MTLSADQKQTARAEIRNLQEIEGNPFTFEDEAIFEMFDREGFSDQQRLDYIKQLFMAPSVSAAE